MIIVILSLIIMILLLLLLLLLSLGAAQEEARQFTVRRLSFTGAPPSVLRNSKVNPVVYFYCISFVFIRCCCYVYLFSFLISLDNSNHVWLDTWLPSSSVHSLVLPSAGNKYVQSGDCPSDWIWELATYCGFLSQRWNKQQESLQNIPDSYFKAEIKSCYILYKLSCLSFNAEVVIRNIWQTLESYCGPKVRPVRRLPEGGHLNQPVCILDDQQQI